MKTTIELTAAESLLEATTNLLEIAKLLNTFEDCGSNILRDKVNKARDLLGANGEKCSTKDIFDNTSKEESKGDLKTDALDLQTLRVLAKEKCTTAGREAVKSLITNLGCDHLEALDKSKYQELFNQLKAL